MTIDPYAPCPGGTGKKIKFCCPDLTTELEKIERMIAGDQRAACLEYLESLREKYPDRACLLATRAMLEASLGQEAKADATLSAFRQKYPDNPVALAESAILEAPENPVAAVEQLQRAIERSGERLPQQVFEALSVVGAALLDAGEIPAARSHFLAVLAGSRGQDKQALNILMQIQGSNAVPLLFKQDLPLAEAPADALWKRPFDEALAKAAGVQWLLAAEMLRALADKAGDWPAIWRNIGILRGWLADRAASIEAWRRYAAQQVPLDDAVEAEALAQLLDDESVDQVDLVRTTYTISDVPELLARLAGQPQAIRLPIDPKVSTVENEPPPKAVYRLLSGPTPASGVGLKREELPQAVGQLFVYGKQTDREARLELVATRTAAGSAAALAAVTGNLMGAAGGEEVVMQLPAVDHLLSVRRNFPADTPVDERRRLIQEQHRENLLENWPQLAQRIFGGRSAREVAADPAYKIKLLAAVLLLEFATDSLDAEFDFNQLRQALQLPLAEPIDPTQIPVATLPLARLARLDIAKLSNQDLLVAFERAEHVRYVRALGRLAREIINRPALHKEIDIASVYGLLAQLETDPRQALAHVDLARKMAEAAGHSSATWDLMEFTMRISQGESAEADRLMRHIRNEHLNEPGVAQALFSVLVDLGLVHPDGTPVGAPAQQPGLVVPGQSSPSTASALWTPGGETAASSSGKKTTIWTPGME